MLELCCSLCSAVFLTLGGEVLLQNSSKKRTIDAEDFFLGPLETIRKEDEILSKVVLPIPRRLAAPIKNGDWLKTFTRRRGCSVRHTG